MSLIRASTVLIFVTSVLTSSVNETHDYHNQLQSLEKLFGASFTGDNKNPTITTSTRSINSKDSDAESKAKIAKQPMAEGGINLPIPESQSSSEVPVYSEGIYSPGVDGSPHSIEKNISQSDNGQKASSIHPRKGVGEEQKIIGRKGVVNTEVLSDRDRSEISTVINKTAIEVPVLNAKPILSPIKNNTKLDDKTNVTVNKNSNVSVLLVPGIASNAITKHKPKPTFTTGEGDDDGMRMPSSPTQAQSGMPGKVDYIIPVVITIMATPILVIAAYVLYTRGRDCWDKRHYRRMDFLIDGMYND